MMEQTYGARDRARGIPTTVAWLAEEIGELAKAVRKGTREEQVHELGDTLAWLASLANQLDITLEESLRSLRPGMSSVRWHPLRLRSAVDLNLRRQIEASEFDHELGPSRRGARRADGLV